jgi:hypothetical protein
MYSTHYPYAVLMKLELWRQFSENIQISAFLNILIVGADLFPCGQTDGRDETSSRLSQFVNAPKKG